MGSLTEQKITVKEVFTTVEDLKVGDIISFPFIGIHPALVIKVKEDNVHVAILSTGNQSIVYSLRNDRFMHKSGVTTTIITIPKEKAIKNYLGSITVLNEIPAIRKAIREGLKDILRIKPKKEWVPMDFEEINAANLGEID